MIYTSMPYAPNKTKDLGQTYNKYFELLPHDSDWMCFIDHDIMLTTKYWYEQLEEFIKRYPDIGFFVTMTNRIANETQLKPGLDRNNHDIKYHRDEGQKQFEIHGYEIKILDDPKHPISGFFMLIQKKVWQQIKFKSGFLLTDQKFFRECLKHNIKVGLMEGLYIYHWYRGDHDRSHLKNNFK